jgi:hypothetical protein
MTSSLVSPPRIGMPRAKSTFSSSVNGGSFSVSRGAMTVCSGSITGSSAASGTSTVGMSFGSQTG